MSMILVGDEKRRMNTTALNAKPEMWHDDLKVVCIDCGVPLRFIDPENCPANKTPGYELKCGCASSEEEKERARKNAEKAKNRRISRENTFIETLKVIPTALSEQFRGARVELGKSPGPDIVIRRGGDDLGIWVYWAGRNGMKMLCDWLELVISREKKQLESFKNGKPYCEVPSMVAILLDDDTLENGLYVPDNSTLQGLVKRNIKLHGLSQDGKLFELSLSERKTNKRLRFKKRMIRNLSKISVTSVDHPKPESARTKTKIGQWIVREIRG